MVCTLEIHIPITSQYKTTFVYLLFDLNILIIEVPYTQFMKKIHEISVVLTNHFVKLCVGGTRSSRTTKSIFLELIDRVCIDCVRDFRSPHVTAYKLLRLKTFSKILKMFVGEEQDGGVRYNLFSHLKSG